MNCPWVILKACHHQLVDTLGCCLPENTLKYYQRQGVAVTCTVYWCREEDGGECWQLRKTIECSAVDHRWELDSLGCCWLGEWFKSCWMKVLLFGGKLLLGVGEGRLGGMIASHAGQKCCYLQAIAARGWRRTFGRVRGSRVSPRKLHSNDISTCTWSERSTIVSELPYTEKFSWETNFRGFLYQRKLNTRKFVVSIIHGDKFWRVAWSTKIKRNENLTHKIYHENFSIYSNC